MYRYIPSIYSTVCRNNLGICSCLQVSFLKSAAMCSGLSKLVLICVNTSRFSTTSFYKKDEQKINKKSLCTDGQLPFQVLAEGRAIFNVSDYTITSDEVCFPDWDFYDGHTSH